MSALLQPEFKQDSFLTQLDELQAMLNRLRDSYIREKFEIGQAVQGVKASQSQFLTVAEVAQITGIEEMTIRAGAAGTNCLYQARVKDGRNVRYPREAVEIHQQNRALNGTCGTCAKQYRKLKENNVLKYRV